MGGLGAAAAELGAAGVGAATGQGADWLPPALPPHRAEAVVVEAAREHLYSANSADDPAGDSAGDAGVRFRSSGETGVGTGGEVCAGEPCCEAADAEVAEPPERVLATASLAATRTLRSSASRCARLASA